MIRPLRRLHLWLWTGLAGVLAVGLVTALGPTPPGVARAGRTVEPVRGAIAVAAWPVDGDTLYLTVLEGSGAVAIGRWTVSAGARWPDAVLFWHPGAPAPTLPDDAQRVVTVGVDVPAVAPLPGPGGAFHLVSLAWGRQLGAWPSPIPPVARRP